MLVPRPFPILTNVFRRINNQTSRLDPVIVTASVDNIKTDVVLTADLHLYFIERRTDRGIPFAPFSIYLNGVELTSGRCDNEGHAVEPLSLPNHRNKIDVYHGRRRLTSASDSLEIIWDNFNDNLRDDKLWNEFKIASQYIGNSRVTETNKRIEILCANTGWGGGVVTKNPVDISDCSIQAKLYTDYYAICALSILPASEPFFSVPYNHGYDIFVWGAGVNKFIIASGTKYVLQKSGMFDNPDPIQIKLEGDTIRFFEGANEVYSETYKPLSKLCNIYLWGQSWYHMKAGTSWVDDFNFVGG